MRCPRCGNDNPETHRFCGMCGASLLQGATSAAPSLSSPGATSAIPAAAATPAAGVAQVATRPAEPAAREVVISGPSFLGLSQPPPPPPRKRASLSIDPHSEPGSSNLDYLLEEEEPSRGGAWKFVVIAVALLLVVGLGYLRWRNHGFSGLTAETAKPSAQGGEVSGSGAAAAAAGGSSPSAPAQDPSPAPAATAPAAGSQAAQPGTDGVPSPASAAPSAPTPPASAAPAATPPPAAADNSAAPAAPAPTPTGSVAADSTPKATTPAPPPAIKDSNSDAPADQPAAPVEKSQPAPPLTRKPAAAIKRVLPPADPVAEAQRYLYGKGTTQDCERGLRILKPAAEQTNPKAMVEMGALYSAGLCTPRDLPTAYRWFAMALRKDPDNQSIQTDLTKLWGEMTQPERQLAIRLSQ